MKKLLSGFNLKIFFVMFLIVSYYMPLGANEYSEKELLETEKELALTAPESDEMFSVLSALSQRYRKTDLSKSKKYYLKLLSLSEKRFGKNSKYSIIFCLGLGNISVEQKNFPEAEKYYSQCFLLAKNTKDIKSLIECQRRLFLMFIETNNHEKAIVAGQNLEINQKNHGDYSENILKIYEDLYAIAVLTQNEKEKNIYQEQCRPILL